MTKYMINEQYDVEDAQASTAFSKGERREDYADAWTDTGNVILVGLAGSGKSELGALLGEKSGMNVVLPETSEQALEVLSATGQVVILSDILVEDSVVQSRIHDSGKVFYLMVDSNMLSTRVAERDGIEDREQLWRDLSARLAMMEPVFYGALHFILQASQSPAEMAEDAMEKIAY